MIPLILQREAFSWDFKRSHYSGVGHDFGAWSILSYLATFLVLGGFRGFDHYLGCPCL